MRLLLLTACFFVHSLAASTADWTDRKEYDLVFNIRSESSPQKRLVLLDAWTKAYPQTPLAGARRELYLHTYEAMNDRVKMFEIAKQMQTDRAEDQVALYWLTVLTPQQPSTTENMNLGESAAKGLLASLDAGFASSKKPASMSDADWHKQRVSVDVIAHQTLGWIDWQRGNLSAAEDEFTECLQKDAGNGEISSWLGIVEAVDNNKQPKALWFLARATSKDLANPLSDDQRHQVNSMLENMYISYHGSLEGLDQLRKVSVSRPIPPPEFSVDPATVVNARRAEAELSTTNPELAAWLAIHRQLAAPDGDKYFAGDIQGKQLPKLRGTVLKATPPRAPREITLAMTQDNTPDVTLKLTVAMPRALSAGTLLSFEGTGDSFTKDPFLLVVNADSAQPEAKTKPQ